MKALGFLVARGFDEGQGKLHQERGLLAERKKEFKRIPEIVKKKVYYRRGNAP